MCKNLLGKKVSIIIPAMSPSALTKLPLPLSAAKGADSIPSVGFGCWKVPRDAAADVVFKVIEAGYRHLDCAADYGNEKEVSGGRQRLIYR